MKTVEVPVWLAVIVTLGVALIGAAGPISAQFINSRREIKKSIREETYKRMAHWRDRRLEIYGDLVELVYKSAYHIGHAAVVAEHRDRMDNLTQAHDIMDDIDKLKSRVIIVTTQATYSEYLEMQEMFRETCKMVLDFAATEVSDEDEVSQDDARAAASEMYRKINDLVRAIRDDLGVSPWS